MVATRSRGYVILADDDLDLLEYYRVVLEAAGFRVTTAGNAAEVMGALAFERPDVLVLDIAMPGLDGIRLSSSLYENDSTRKIPIVLVTALKSFDAGSHLLMEMENIRRVMFKPLPAETLVAGVDDATRWHG